MSLNQFGRINIPGWEMLEPNTEERILPGDVSMASWATKIEEGGSLNHYARMGSCVKSYVQRCDQPYQIYRKVGGWKPESSISEVYSLPVPLP